MSQVIEELRKQIHLLIEPQVQQSTQKFFKEPVKSYGCKTAPLIVLAKQTFRHLPQQDKKTIFQYCEELWQSGYLEETFIACEWCYAVREQYQAEDILLFENWLQKYVTNWASCDTLCNHSVGSLVERFPARVASVKKWAHSPNRWLRRASAVTFIIPARKGLFLPEIFAIATELLSDSEDLVQKGYGWMLKAASQAHPEEVYEFLIKYKSVMPRTAFRYALEKMPAELKKAAMRKD